jgi:hypothetical protein
MFASAMGLYEDAAPPFDIDRPPKRSPRLAAGIDRSLRGHDTVEAIADIPFGRVSDTQLHCHSRRDHRRENYEVGVMYATRLQGSIKG